MIPAGIAKSLHLLSIIAVLSQHAKTDHYVKRNVFQVNRPPILPARRRTELITILTSCPNLAASSSSLASLAPRNWLRVMRYIKKILGQPGFRLRVGDWRVIYDVEQGRLVVLVLMVRLERVVLEQPEQVRLEAEAGHQQR